MKKKRLDLLIQERLPQLSRTRIVSLIMQGNVTVNKSVITKPGTLIKPDDNVDLKYEEQQYVSRAGFKLEKALEHFKINVENLVVLDAGLSTGGFADCLLQKGAKLIYGVDVGYGQVHEKIRKNPHVVVIERTNLRQLTELPEKVDLVTLDLSFISVLKVMPAVVNLMKENAGIIILIKPQFEAERKQVTPGGIIKDSKVHKEVIDKIISGVKKFGFSSIGVTSSPILGSSGNKEFLAYFIRKVQT